MTNLLQQAVTYHQKGQIAEAERLYRVVLTNSPKNADAMALLGVALDSRGDQTQAIDLIQKAILLDNKAPLFKLYLGNALMNAKRPSEAIVVFRQLISLLPKLAEAHYNLANALRRIEDWSGAIASYEEAIQINPHYAEAYMNLALTFVHEKKYGDALKQAKKSVEVAPSYGEGWLALCNIAEQCNDFDLAVEAGKRNIELLPQDNRAWFGYGVALNRVDRNEEAIDAYKQALRLKPDRADIWDNLAQTYQSLNWLDDAEAAFHKTIEVAGQNIPDEDSRDVAESEYGNRHWHLALMELLRGKYKKGFARYRSRFGEVGGLVRPNFSKPLWKGEDLTGKTLVVCDEQGFGDTLMLARYLPLLKYQGARIIFSIHSALKPLFNDWSAVDDIITHGSTIHNYDYYTSVFDLPHCLGTELDSIPANIPYLPHLPPSAETQLEGNGRKKIGVVWGGSPLHGNDARRSIPLKIFSELFGLDHYQFFSLNRDKKVGDADLLPQYPVTDLAPRLTSFADGARFIEQMDLVITCDTATAHLAGGLGKPVWVLLPFAPDWRWLTDREDNPWYPTARLFRQPRISDWQSVIDQVKQALNSGIS